MFKKIAIAIACCLASLVIFLLAFCRFNPEGGIYWTFITYAPVITAGDGASIQTAYLLKKGQTRWLTTVEIETIRDKYWIPSGGSYEDFYHHCYDTLAFTNAALNNRNYDIIAFKLPSGTNTVYFDITYYRDQM